MNFNLKMPKGLKVFYDEEINNHKRELAAENLHAAWSHLERAHVIGQNWPAPHTEAHWLMLRFGMHIKSVREIIGQIPRLVFGGVKSFVGRVPVGNTGGANVPILQPMDIPEDIAAILKSHRAE